VSDAYALVGYCAVGRHLGARIWNGTNAKPPETILLDDGSLARRNRGWDEMAPHHRPVVGEPIFWAFDGEVDEEVIQLAWSSLSDWERSSQWFGYNDFKAGFLWSLERDVELGAPILIRVTEELAQEQGWL
jgi:hypothetical protein